MHVDICMKYEINELSSFSQKNTLFYDSYIYKGINAKNGGNMLKPGRRKLVALRLEEGEGILKCL